MAIILIPSSVNLGANSFTGTQTITPVSALSLSAANPQISIGSGQLNVVGGGMNFQTAASDVTGVRNFTGTAAVLGTNPATSGAIRSGNNPMGGVVVARNAANNGDVSLLQLDASNNFTIGTASFGASFPGTTTFNGTTQCAGVFNPAAFTATQFATSLYAGTGVPPNANGNNGDYYLRADGGVTAHLYFKSAGAWVGLI